MSTNVLGARSPLFLPAGARAFVEPGHIDVMSNMHLMRQIGLIEEISGSDRGTSTQSDIVTQTTDGVSLDRVWADFQAVLASYNARRTTMVDFLTYKVTNPVETVMQATGGDDFEIASEFGVPKGLRTKASSFQMGFPFEWYDVAGRFTWKFLIDASAAQVESIHNSIIEADNRLVFGEVMRTLFDNTNRAADINDRPYTVYAAYNGDGTVPPQYKSTTFPGTHTHYMVSGSLNTDRTANAPVGSGGDAGSGALISGFHLDALIKNVTEHGFDAANNSTIVVMLNSAETARVRNFRNVANLSAAAAAVKGLNATYDFIPAQGTPSLLMPRDMIVGTAQQPANTYQGLKVVGSYGDALIVEEDYIPSGYAVCFATGGTNSLTNPLGIREHTTPGLRGLRLVKGRDNDYPLQESYYQRGFGVGIRQRGSLALMQFKDSGTYAVPTAYAR